MISQNINYSTTSLYQYLYQLDDHDVKIPAEIIKNAQEEYMSAYRWRHILPNQIGYLSKIALISSAIILGIGFFFSLPAKVVFLAYSVFFTGVGLGAYWAYHVLQRNRLWNEAFSHIENQDEEKVIQTIAKGVDIRDYRVQFECPILVGPFGIFKIYKVSRREFLISESMRTFL